MAASSSLISPASAAWYMIAPRPFGSSALRRHCSMTHRVTGSASSMALRKRRFFGPSALKEMLP